MRLAVIVTATVFATSGLCAAQSSRAAIANYELNIPRQPLDTALKDLAQQTGLQVGRFSDAIKGDVVVGPVTGNYSAEQALETLLAPTRLTYRALNDRAVIVLRPEDIAQFPSTNSHAADTQSRSGETSGGEDSAAAGDRKSVWERLRLAQTFQGLAQSAASVGPQEARVSQDTSVKLEEVIVTAQKRAERLQDVPIPVTAINTDALIENSQLRLQDYYTSIPGFSVATQSAHPTSLVSIRGITTGSGTNPTVGVTVDDVPYGSSTNLGGGSLVDFDPGDLARVEVLRGPQGTLYGASSMGGLLKFVTLDPSTDGVSGRIQAGMSDTHDGAEPGYNFRGSVNVPLGDSFAVRASGFTRRDPGYIDNVQTGQRDVNEAKVYGAHLSALWRPCDALSLKLSALFQDAKSDGSNDIDLPINGYSGPPLRDLQQNYLRGTGAQDARIQAYSATLTAKVGGVDLTALTGYNINSFSDSNDYTYALGPLASRVFRIPGLGAEATDDNKTKKLTQEIRLSTGLGPKVDWLLGVFYTHEDSQFVQASLGADPVTGTIVGEGLHLSFPTTYSEYAAFTNVTVHITDRFDVQLGAREGHIETALSQTEAGQFVPVLLGVTPPVVLPEEDSKANAFTYLVTPRFKVSADLMVYARLASGYRAGGANGRQPDAPSQYDPDKTQSYEAGLKGDWFHHALEVDTSLYYIDWNRIQVELQNPQTGLIYVANAGRAKSQGVEFSVHSRPAQGLTIDAWVAWNDAELTQAFPATSTVQGASGNRLPYSARWSGSLSLEQDFPLGGNVSGFLGGSVSYIGDRQGQFTRTPQRQDLLAYAKTDLRAGAKYGPWTASLFVNNIADQRGVLDGGLGRSPAFGFTYIQPRTVGLSIARAF